MPSTSALASFQAYVAVSSSAADTTDRSRMRSDRFTNSGVCVGSDDPETSERDKAQNAAKRW